MPKDTPQNPPQNAPQEPASRTLDSRSLRGLAHPLRLRLLNALRRYGPATASQLGKRLGESSGATSYHLRQLAEYGFVEDAPEHGKGRERWWRAAVGSVRYDSTAVDTDDPEIRGAADVLMHEVAAAHYKELTTWIADRDRWQGAWAQVGDLSDMTLRLSARRLEELTLKMHALVDSYDTTEFAEEAGTEEVRVHLHAVPVASEHSAQQ